MYYLARLVVGFWEEKLTKGPCNHTIRVVLRSQLGELQYQIWLWWLQWLFTSLLQCETPNSNYSTILFWFRSSWRIGSLSILVGAAAAPTFTSWLRPLFTFFEPLHNFSVSWSGSLRAWFWLIWRWMCALCARAVTRWTAAARSVVNSRIIIACGELQ